MGDRDSLALRSNNPVTLEDVSGSSIQESGIQQKIGRPYLSHDERLQREIHLYRLKYIFNCSCFTFCSSFKRRIPTGRNYFIILIMLGLEQMAYSSASEFVISPFLKATDLREGLHALVRIVGLRLFTDLLFPITGWMADVWVGRYRMIHLSSWVIWFGYSLAALSIAFWDSDDNWNKYILLPCYIIINIGSAAFQASAIPFGADQIVYTTSHELSSYFYMYYWMRNLGASMLYLTVTNCYRFKGFTYSLIYVGIGVLASTGILTLNAIFKDDFVTDKLSYNPLKNILKVLYSSATIKRPLYRSAFSYNTAASKPSRIDLTKIIHGGKFDEEIVEDVKTFLRLAILLLPLVIVLVVYTGVLSVTDLQVLSFDQHFLPIVSNCTFSHSFTWVFNGIGVLTFVPIVNWCILPCLREFAPTILLKILIGIIMLIVGVCTLLSLVGVTYADATNSGEKLTCLFNLSLPHEQFQERFSPLSVWWLTLPHSLVALAEILIIISSIEFFYAQSPHTMRGMMIGFFFFIWGLASVITESIITIFQMRDLSGVLTCEFWYYFILLLISGVGLAVFLRVYVRYKNRERGEIIPVKYYRQVIY